MIAEQELDYLLEQITDGMSFNLGKIMELVWLAHHSESKEIPLRGAAHYLGRELDIVLKDNKEEKEWDEEISSKPVVEDSSFQVEGKCVGCGNYILLNRESGLCNICVSRSVMETENP